MLILVIMAALVVFICGWLVSPRVKIRLHIAGGTLNVNFNIRFFYRIFSTNIVLVGYLKRGETTGLFRKQSNGALVQIVPAAVEPRPLVKLVQELPFSQYLSWLKVSLLQAELDIGTGDAQVSVLLAAASKLLFEEISNMLFYVDKPQIMANGVPYFEERKFHLKMEGILTVHHVKIIVAVLKAVMKVKRRKNA